MRADRVPTSSPLQRTAESASPRFVLSGRSVEEFKGQIAVGDILSGKVLESLGDGKSVVRFMGFNLVTQSEGIPFEKGQMIRGEVSSVGEQVTLKFLPAGSNLSQAMALLEESGIPASRGNLQLLAFMAKADIPLTPGNLQTLLQQVGQLPNQPDTAGLVVLAKALNVPTSEASIEALRALTTPQRPMGDTLAEMANQLQRLSVSSFQLPVASSERTTNGLESLQKMLTDLPVKPDVDFVPRQLQWFMRWVGTNLESQLNRDGQMEPSLKGLLLMARTELAQRAALSAGETLVLVEGLRRNVDGLLRQLDAYQMLSKIPSYDLPHLYLQIPYLIGQGNPLTLEVRGKKEKPDGEVDPDNTELEFSVRTKRWGVVRIRLAIRAGRVTGLVEAETREAEAYVRARLPRLTDRIHGVGYSVQRFVAGLMGVPDLPEPVVPRLELARGYLEMEA